MNPLNRYRCALARLALLSLLWPSFGAVLVSPARAIEPTTTPEQASLVVDSLADVSADDGVTTLREALAFANSTAEADTITFSPDVSGTLTLTGGQLEITSDLTIEGPTDRSITISGNNASRVFSIKGTTTQATISHLTLTGGFVKGADGAAGKNGPITYSPYPVPTSRYNPIPGDPGGSGDTAKGGAIWNEGNLRVEAVTLNANTVRGGKGGKGGWVGLPITTARQTVAMAGQEETRVGAQSIVAVSW